MKQAEKHPDSLLPGDHIYVLRSVSYAHHGKVLFTFFFLHLRPPILIIISLLTTVYFLKTYLMEKYED